MIVTRFEAEKLTAVPAEFLAELGLLPGDAMSLEIIDGALVIRPLDEDEALTDDEVRAALAEVDERAPTFNADEVFGGIRTMLEERRRPGDA